MAKARSPNYPALGLGDAISLVDKLYKAERRTPISYEVAARALGYKSLSGPARSAVSALRKYGLLEEQGQRVRVSDDAIRLMNLAPESPEYLALVRQMALTPELFRELYQTHSEASDNAIKSYLLLSKEFSEHGAKQFIKAFKDTLAFAKLPDSSYTGTPRPAVLELQSVHGTSSVEPVRFAETHPEMTIYSWPLSKSVTVEVRFNSPHITAQHLEQLREYLKIAEKALVAEELDDAPEPA